MSCYRLPIPHPILIDGWSMQPCIASGLFDVYRVQPKGMLMPFWISGSGDDPIPLLWSWFSPPVRPLQWRWSIHLIWRWSIHLLCRRLSPLKLPCRRSSPLKLPCGRLNPLPWTGYSHLRVTGLLQIGRLASLGSCLRKKAISVGMLQVLRSRESLDGFQAVA